MFILYYCVEKLDKRTLEYFYTVDSDSFVVVTWMNKTVFEWILTSDLINGGHVI